MDFIWKKTLARSRSWYKLQNAKFLNAYNVIPLNFQRPDDKQTLAQMSESWKTLSEEAKAKYIEMGRISKMDYDVVSNFNLFLRFNYFIDHSSSILLWFEELRSFNCFFFIRLSF